MLVEGVAGLVQGGEEGGGEAAGIEAGGDADVSRPAEVYAERVRRPVLAAAAPVVPERGGDGLSESLLPSPVECAPERGRAVARSGGDGAHHVRRAAFEVFEHGFEAGLGGAGFVAVEEGVVGVVFVAETIRRLPLQVQDLLQVGDEGAEVAVGACPPPGRLREGGGARSLGDQPRRELRGAFVFAAGDADHGRSVRARFRVSGVQQPGGLFGGGDAVREAAQGGEGLRAGGDAAWGHVRLLVPVEDRRGRVEVGGGGEVVDQGSGVFIQVHEEGT